MPISVACECGHEFKVQDELRGQKFKCPSCGESVRVAGASTNSVGAKSRGTDTQSDLLAFLCGCGKRIAAKREWAGKKIKCPGCGDAVRIPGDKQDAQPTSDRSSLDSILDEVGVSAQVAQRCPNCRSEMKAEHVICVKCGFDLERGKQLRTKTYRSSAKQLDMEAGAKEKRSNLPMKFAAAAFIIVVLVVAAVLVPKFLS